MYNEHFQPDETVDEYIDRICRDRKLLGFTWTYVALLLNDELGYHFSESYYRKRFAAKMKNYVEDAEQIDGGAEVSHVETAQPVDEVSLKLIEMQKQRMKLSEERTKANAFLRRISREETIREIAHDFASQMNAKRMLEEYSPQELLRTYDKCAILEISDWHYGLVCDNYWNKYDPDIAKQRVNTLLRETIRRCINEGVGEIHVVNLADLIAGRIHLTLRLQSRIDVISQIMQVSELLAQFLNELTKHFNVHYYDCLDNHSRLEPNKSDSLDMESLARITPWYLIERCKHVNFHTNEFGADIINFNVLGHEVVGVHGDKDKPSTVIDNLTMMTHKHYDLVLTAHLHHFSCDEKNETVVVSNGSLMGTDAYAEKLRLSSKPSQNLIIVSEDNVVDEIHRIVVG